MDYKTILLQLDEKPRRLERLRLALRLAEAFGAHVTARFAMRAPAPYVAGEAIAIAIEMQERERVAAAAAAQRELEAEARAGEARCEWRDASGDFGADHVAAARCADLIVAGQPEPGDALPWLAAGDLVLGAGRPVLFVPYAGRFEACGSRVLVAWNGSRESARALADALPLLRRAQAVHVVTFDDARTPAPSADVGTLLARHGVKATLGHQRAAATEAGEDILSRAADLGADLVVMGGYGHARLRERVLGGATRTLLGAMTVPVLMSH